MDKVRRKVNQVFKKQTDTTNTTSSAGGFEDSTPIVAGVANIIPSHIVGPPQHESRHSVHYSQRREFYYQNQMINNEPSAVRRRRRRRHPRSRNNNGAE